MSGALRKYIGKYTVLAEYDHSTNDWVRDEYGQLDESFDDYYIPLENNMGKILSYDDEALILNVSTLDVGLFRKLQSIQKKNPIKGAFDLVGGGECLLHVKDLEKFLTCIKPMTKNKNRDPFDYRNLPTPYKIPAKDLKLYEPIASEINKLGNFKLANLSREFIITFSNLSDFKKSGLTFNGFIHQNNKWEEFINFLRKNVK